MNTEKERLLSLVDENQNELIELLSSLVQVDTTIPPGDTREAIEIIQNYLSRYDQQGYVVESGEQKHNLVVETGNHDRSSLCLNGHLDVVPVEKEDWDFEPFSGAVKDNKVLGRGASDMKSGLAGLIFAFVHMQDYFEKDKLTLMAVTDEERGGMEGTNRVLHRSEAVFDGCLIAEPTRPHSISVGQKGAVWVRFSFQAEGGHGSLSPYKGQEVFGAVSKLKTRLEGLREYASDLADVPEDLINYSRESLRKLTGNSSAGDLLDHISVNCGKINIGTAPNAVGSNATVWFDFRIPVGIHLDFLWNEVNDIVQDIPNIKSHEFVKEKSPNWTHPDSELVQLLSRNAEEQYDQRPQAFMSQGSSDASYYRLRGIDTAQMGPGNIETIHAPNETVDIPDFLKSAKTYIGFLYDWLNH